MKGRHPDVLVEKGHEELEPGAVRLAGLKDPTGGQPVIVDGEEARNIASLLVAAVGKVIQPERGEDQACDASAFHEVSRDKVLEPGHREVGGVVRRKKSRGALVPGGLMKVQGQAQNLRPVRCVVEASKVSEIGRAHV